MLLPVFLDLHHYWICGVYFCCHSPQSNDSDDESCCYSLNSNVHWQAELKNAGHYEDVEAQVFECEEHPATDLHEMKRTVKSVFANEGLLSLPSI